MTEDLHQRSKHNISNNTNVLKMSHTLHQEPPPPLRQKLEDICMPTSSKHPPRLKMPNHKMFQINSRNLSLSHVISQFLNFMTNGDDKQLVVVGMRRALIEQKLQNQPTKSPEIASNS